MSHFSSAFFVVALGLASIAHASPDGIPLRPMSLGNWYDHDPVNPRPGREPWTTSDVAGFLQLYPNAYFELGYGDGKPPGNKGWLDMAAQTAELRAKAAARGVDTRSRLCIIERPDIMIRNAPNVAPCATSRGGGGCDWEGDMNGSKGEPEDVVRVSGRASNGAPNALIDSSQRWSQDLWANRLVVLRPGTASEERRRVAWNDGQTLAVGGDWAQPPRPDDAYEVRGTFDESWVRQVPLARHRETIARFWEGERNVCDGPCNPPAESLDPFEARRGFETWVDRDAIVALRTPTSVPALWGNTMDAGNDPLRAEDPHFRANSVVMDVSNPQYRAWRAHYMLYKLEDYGFAKSDGVCLLVGYKPGAHTFHDPALGTNPHACSEPDTHTWYGPAQVCTDGTLYPGALHPTPFRSGEYEAGISAYFRELVSTLAADGWSNVRVITAEAPGYLGRNWNILADDVRRLPQLYGEQGGWIHPPLSELATLETPGPDPGPGPADGGETPAPGGDPVAGGGDPSEGGGDPAAGSGDPAPPGAGAGGAGSGSGSASRATATPPASDDSAQRGFVSSSSGGGGGGAIEPPAP